MCRNSAYIRHLSTSKHARALTGKTPRGRRPQHDSYSPLKRVDSHAAARPRCGMATLQRDPVAVWPRRSSPRRSMKSARRIAPNKRAAKARTPRGSSSTINSLQAFTPAHATPACATLYSSRPHAPRAAAYAFFLPSFAFTRPTTVGMTETSTIPTISSSKCS